MKMSDLFRRYRENSGLSQEQVAKILNVDRSTYTYYETGKTQPSINTVLRLSKIFNVPYTEFFKTVEQEQNGDRSVADYLKSDSGSKRDDGEAREEAERMKIYDLSNDEQMIVLRYRSFDESKKEKAKNFFEEQSK